jgi:hypothetical protein
MRMNQRLSRLETATPDLSPAVKQWLGMELTESEQAYLDDGAGIDSDFDANADYSSLSSQARKWLGL